MLHRCPDHFHLCKDVRTSTTSSKLTRTYGCSTSPDSTLASRTFIKFCRPRESCLYYVGGEYWIARCSAGVNGSRESPIVHIAWSAVSKLQAKRGCSKNIVPGRQSSTLTYNRARPSHTKSPTNECPRAIYCVSRRTVRPTNSHL